MPIIPDEARTFGMDPLFREIGIYSPKGQLYEPVDRESLLFYRESKDGQILEEGHHRSRSDVVVHRGGDGLRKPRREHDPVLHLLFHVRIPAHRRSGMGGG